MLENIKLTFEFSKEQEVARVVSTIKRLGWYRSKGYSTEVLAFPAGIDLNNIEEISELDIEKAIETEYNPDKYKSTVESMEQLYLLYEPKLTKFIKSLNVPVIPKILVNLTIYGIAGSYSLPNRVIVNISKFYSIGLLRNILHEIIHLHIEFFVEKYQIGQWEKESITNMLFESAFPEIHKKNKNLLEEKDLKNIETIYRENFPNIEKIISLIPG